VRLIEAAGRKCATRGEGLWIAAQRLGQQRSANNGVGRYEDSWPRPTERPPEDARGRGASILLWRELIEAAAAAARRSARPVRRHRLR